MRNEDEGRERGGRMPWDPPRRIPQPTAAFRRRAWLQFQRALDPLGPPKPLKLPPRQ